MSLLDEVLSRVNKLPGEVQTAIKAQALKATASMLWVPNPGPQSDAYECLADQTLYGGEAGGGKTDLLIGLATQEHKRSLILRRINKEVEFLAERAEQILGHRNGYNGQKGRWALAGRTIQFGGCQHPGDEKGYKGEPKDFIGIDEASEFLEGQVDFILGWLRSADPGQRCRAVFATNPPTTVEGEWVVRWFAPWLDPQHPLYPQPCGKLLYCVRDGEHFRFSESPEPVDFNGRLVKPISRTFIRSGLSDNPDYAATDYADRLAQLPEALRRRYAEGDFTAGMEDAEFQVIPTAWILEAQDRWRPDGGKEFTMTAMAFDPAGGGKDAAVLCWRHGGWYAPLTSERGEHTADGSAAAGRIVAHRRDAAPVVVDAGGGAGDGFGGSTIMRLKDNGVTVVAFNGVKPSTLKTRDGSITFANKRAEAWWKFREALDPDQQWGSPIALPPDSELRADLAAPTFEVSARGLLVEDKKDIKKRLGRSPDKGDAVVMCFSEGNVAVRRALGRDGRKPEIKLGYSSLKRRFGGR